MPSPRWRLSHSLSPSVSGASSTHFLNDSADTFKPSVMVAARDHSSQPAASGDTHAPEKWNSPPSPRAWSVPQTHKKDRLSDVSLVPRSQPSASLRTSLLPRTTWGMSLAMSLRGRQRNRILQVPQSRKRSAKGGVSSYQSLSLSLYRTTLLPIGGPALISPYLSSCDDGVSDRRFS